MITPSAEKHPLRDTFVTGVGFASDSYDLFVIGIVLVILQDLYPDSSNAVPILASVSLAAAVCGQLVFGYLAARFGRKKLFVITLLLISFGAIASGCVFDTKAVSIFWMMIGCRFILGFGIGGEYPLAATIAKEKSNDNQKTVLVFSGQGIGILLAAVLFLALVKFTPLYILWRVLLVFGGVPGLLTIYWRVKMKETSQFEKIQLDIGVGEETPVGLKDLKENWRPLLGTCLTWFLFDVTFYGNGIFAATILSNLVQGELHEKLFTTALFNLAVAVISLLGYLFASYTIDKFNKRNQQLLGFIAVAVIFGTLGKILPYIRDNIFIFTAIYGFTFFASNWGPNTTTFVLPTIVFTAKNRPLFHGISAASGKLGAVVGAAMMKPLDQHFGTDVVMYISAGVAVLGALATFLLPKYVENEEMVSMYDKINDESA